MGSDVWLFCELYIASIYSIIHIVRRGTEETMKFKIALLTLEFNNEPKKKSPAPQKPKAQSNSQKTEINITQKI